MYIIKFLIHYLLSDVKLVNSFSLCHFREICLTDIFGIKMYVRISHTLEYVKKNYGDCKKHCVEFIVKMFVLRYFDFK